MPGAFGSLFGGGGSQPSGASGSGTGSTANVYTPYNQPQQDINYNNVLSSFLGAGAAGLPNVNPAGTAYGQAVPIVNADLVNNPYAAQALAGAQGGAQYGASGSAGINNAAGSILQQSMDPQNALFAQQQQRVLDQANAANAAGGLGGSPYAAGLTNQALSNFDTNWQNQQLQRQIQGLGAAESGFPTATNLAAQAAGLPYQTSVGQGTTGLSGLSNLANLGQSGFALPQQALNDIQSYLQLGQAASNLSGNLGALGSQQAGLGLQGLGQLVGGAGGLSGIGSGIGNLIGSTGAADAGSFLIPGTDTALATGATADLSGITGGGGSGILGFLGSLFG